MKLWICVVRREAFVGGESQRCRHSQVCDFCEGAGRVSSYGSAEISTEDNPRTCPTCNGTGQVWDEGLVEVVAEAIHSKDDSSYVNDWSKLADWRKDEYREWARAVLAALTAKVGK